jgi:hypothetical protein
LRDAIGSALRELLIREGRNQPGDIFH